MSALCHKRTYALQQFISVNQPRQGASIFQRQITCAVCAKRPVGVAANSFHPFCEVRGQGAKRPISSIVAFEKLWSENNNTSVARVMINHTNRIVITVCF